MGNMFASFNTGVSGLHSAQTSINTTAHNLSNTTTPGYVRQQAMITDSQYTTRYGSYGNRMQIGLGTDVVQIRQIRNEFLDAQYRLQFSRQSFYEAQYSAVDEIQEIFGELEGEEFLTTLETDLWGALSRLQEEPNNIVYRSQLVSVAGKFVEQAQVIRNHMVQFQENMNQEVQNQVNRINEIVSGIRDYNILIRRYEATGEQANDFRDSRNLLMDELSSYINYKPIEERDGTISIYAEGGFLLETNVQFKLKTAKESETSKLLKPVWESGDSFFLRNELEYSVENKTDTGSLRGLLVARGTNTTNYTDIPVKPKEEDFTDAAGVFDRNAYLTASKLYEDEVENYNATLQPSIFMTVEAEFDQLIHGVVTMINDVFCPNKEIELADGTKMMVLDTEKAAVGDDADETIGTELFVRRGTPRYTKVNVTVGTTNYEVYRYNGEDVDDPYSLYTTDQLEVNPELIKDPSKLPLNANPNDPHVGGFEWDMCETILKKWQEDFSALDPNSMTTYNFAGYYGAMVGQFGTLGNIWGGIVENQQGTVHSIDNDRQNVMGVYSDEELSDLIKFQQCYNASSRYITVVDEMIEHLIMRM